MSIGPLIGVSGKIKTLLDRLTAGRASNLDRLDATISSRAAAATALSTASWTNTRAGKLDFLDASVAANKPLVYKFQLFTASGTWVRPAKHYGDTVLVTAIGGGGGAVNASSLPVYGRGGSAGQAIQRLPWTVAGNQTVTIGAGGARSTANQTEAGSGGNTSFGSMTVRGGRGGHTGSFSLSTSTQDFGPQGGIYTDDTTPFVAAPQGHGGLFGAGPTPVAEYGQASEICGGASGLILGSTLLGGEKVPGNASAPYRGIGYGAGGANYSSATLNSVTLGIAGAVLVEWWETP